MTRRPVETETGRMAGLTIAHGLGYRAVCLTCGETLPGHRFYRSEAAALLLYHDRLTHAGVSA